MFHAKPTELRDAARSLGGLSKLIELFRIEGPVIFIKHALQRYASPCSAKYISLSSICLKRRNLSPLRNSCLKGSASKFSREMAKAVGLKKSWRRPR